jgi:hypothetical protein
MVLAVSLGRAAESQAQATTQTPPPTGDIAPAIVVKVPSVSLESEQVMTILLRRPTPHQRELHRSALQTLGLRPMHSGFLLFVVSV